METSAIFALGCLSGVIIESVLIGLALRFLATRKWGGR